MAVALLATTLLAVRLLLSMLPYPGAERLESLAFSRIYYDREGRELAILPANDDGLRRILVPYAELPDDLPRIIRRAEDRRFFFHPGVDLFSAARAAYQYLLHREAVTGGSTVTMQLSSMLYPRPDTVAGKLGEMCDALLLDARLGKREILELYAALVPMGRNVEGFEAAARLYYGRELSSLEPSELAALAAVPRSPTRYGVWSNREESAVAARRILGGTTDSWSDPAERVRDPERPGVWPAEAPHFVRYIDGTLGAPTIGAQAGGVPAQGASGGALATGGRETLRVKTTLDLDLQRHLEAVLLGEVTQAGEYRISNGAGILADPETGEILAYAGSADFGNREASGEIDGVRILREPGSTLKPFLYAQAFEMGFTPATVVPDIPLDFGSEEVYVPGNFNQQYHGPLRIRQALSSSLNVPAVYTLERISVDRFAEKLIDLGFSSITEQRGSLGVSLAIGGGEVSLFELVQGYLSFYSDGNSPPLSPRSPAPTAAAPRWSPATASMIRDILSANDERIMTFGRNSPLRTDYPVAIKTGTSNQFNNIWAVGFSEELAGGVWMGNFSGETVLRAPGSSLPAKALRRLLDAHSSGTDLPRLVGVHRQEVCAVSGMGATEWCGATVSELFPVGRVPEPCNWHRVNGGRVTLHYPQEYQLWAEEYGYRLLYQEEAELAILSPVEGAVFYYDPTLPEAAQQLRLFLTGSGNGELRVDGSPFYRGKLPVSLFWSVEPGRHYFELVGGEERVVRTILVR